MAHKFASAAEAELACPVCFQYYVSPHEPKNLPKCAHICCRLCLTKMTEGGLKTIKCPQCNKEALLSAEGIDGLTTILALRNLAERHPEGIKQRKEQLQNDLDKERADKTKIINELEKLEKQTRLSIKQEEMEIQKSAEILINEIRNMCKSKVTEIRQQRSHFEAHIKNIETVLSKLRTIPDDEFLTQSDSIVNQIEKLQIDHSTQISGDHQLGKFIPNTQLGRIVEPRRLKLVQEFGEFEGACSIASKPTGIIAVSDFRLQPPKVIVFQNEDGEYKKRFQFDVKSAVKGTFVDVASSPDGRYLIAKGGAGFHLYSPDGKCQKSVSTLTYKPSQRMKEETLSIASTADGRVLAGSAIGAKGNEWFVTVHEPSGNILKTIPISIMPGRIADIRGTHVAVSEFKGNKVCMYDLQSGKETLSLDIHMPFGISFDEQSDCMLIGRMAEKDENGHAVHASGVIEQYCSITGKLVARLAHGLRGPTGMTRTHDGMLAVTNVKTVMIACHRLKEVRVPPIVQVELGHAVKVHKVRRIGNLSTKKDGLD